MQKRCSIAKYLNSLQRERKKKHHTKETKVYIFFKNFGFNKNVPRSYIIFFPTKNKRPCSSK